MKTKLLVEGRDDGYLFLDPEHAHPDAVDMDFVLAPGVLFRDVEDDNEVVWMSTDTGVRVVKREGVDWNAPFDKEWPIPSACVCLTLEDYEALIARHG